MHGLTEEFRTDPVKRQQVYPDQLRREHPYYPASRLQHGAGSRPPHIQNQRDYVLTKSDDVRMYPSPDRRHTNGEHHRYNRVPPTAPLYGNSNSSRGALPGMSALLQSSGSPPARPLPDARVHRAVSWSSAGSAMDSPNARPIQSSHHWIQNTERHTDETNNRRGSYMYSPPDPESRSSVQIQPRPVSSTPPVRYTTKSPLGNGSTTSSTSEDDDATSSNTTAVGKNSRYLREMDRRAILDRLANGEKQATLAKEYQVSRAAICNLNKHRDEVMSRADENPFAKHPKKRKLRTSSNSSTTPSTSGSGSSTLSGSSVSGHDDPVAYATSSSNGTTTPTATSTSDALPTTTVHVVKSRAIQLLLTTLRNMTTTLPEFQRSSERLMRLVLEDALAIVPFKPVEVHLNDQVKMEGVGAKHPPCAISMEQHHCPMMDLFHVIEPDHPTGYVRIHPEGTSPTSTPSVHLLDAHLPPSLRFHNVFLFDLVAGSGETVCEIIQQLKERGAVDARIHIVALFVSSEVVAMVQCKFPGVQIVTTVIDSSLNKKNATRRGSSLDNVLARLARLYNDDHDDTHQD